MTEFLLEINTEEMPSSHVKAGLGQLREKIEDDPGRPRRIVTVWGVGYKYEP